MEVLKIEIINILKIEEIKILKIEVSDAVFLPSLLSISTKS
jgi:hypothetical protein